MRTTTSPASAGHQPVLLTETITLLHPNAGGRYLDGTFGGGGHTRAILEASAPDGIVLALDADPAAIARGETLRSELTDPSRLQLAQANFANMATIASETGFAPVDGILLDLGLSSFQLHEAARGFAFQHEGPLDMRFDPNQGQPAAELVNTLPQDALADLIYRYGEEPRSRRIAAAIVRARQEAPILTTTQLAEIVSRALGGRRGRDIHPATQTFQALRIAVNGELEVLPRALDAALTILAPGGRLAVISFHSLEDRIVKRFIQRESTGCICPPEQPVCTCNHQPRLRPLTRAVRASAAEQARNPRSRSATLRGAERLADEAAIPGDGRARTRNSRTGRSVRDSSPGLIPGSRLRPTALARPDKLLRAATQVSVIPSEVEESPRAAHGNRVAEPRNQPPAFALATLLCQLRWHALRAGIPRFLRMTGEGAATSAKRARIRDSVGCSRLISLSPGFETRAELSNTVFPNRNTDATRQSSSFPGGTTNTYESQEGGSSSSPSSSDRRIRDQGGANV